MFSEHAPLYLLITEDGRTLSSSKIDSEENSLLLVIDDAISATIHIAQETYSTNLISWSSVAKYTANLANNLSSEAQDILLDEFGTQDLNLAIVGAVAEYISVLLLGFLGVLGDLNIFPESVDSKNKVLDCLTTNLCRYISIPLNAYSLLLEGFGKVLVFRLLEFCSLFAGALEKEPKIVEPVEPAQGLVRFYEVVSNIPVENFVDGIRSEKYRSLRALNATLEKILADIGDVQPDSKHVQKAVKSSLKSSVQEQFSSSKQRIRDVNSILSAYVNMISEL